MASSYQSSPNASWYSCKASFMGKSALWDKEMYQLKVFPIGRSYLSRTSCHRFMIGRASRNIFLITIEISCQIAISFGKYSMVYMLIELKRWSNRQRLKECLSRLTFKINNGDFSSSPRSLTSFSSMTSSPVSTWIQVMLINQILNLFICFLV